MVTTVTPSAFRDKYPIFLWHSPHIRDSPHNPLALSFWPLFLCFPRCFHLFVSVTFISSYDINHTSSEASASYHDDFPKRRPFPRRTLTYTPSDIVPGRFTPDTLIIPRSSYISQRHTRPSDDMFHLLKPRQNLLFQKISICPENVFSISLFFSIYSLSDEHPSFIINAIPIKAEGIPSFFLIFPQL